MAICGTKTHLASIKSGCFIASLYPSISRLINFSRCNPCDSLSDLPLIVSLVIGADSSLTLSIRIALGLGTSAPESSVSSFLFLTHHPSSTHTIPRTYAVMGGGAISFSFHRRCGIYVLLIHSDIFFYASNDRSMLIPFSSKTEVAGRWRTQGLGRKIQPGAPGAEVWRFSLPTVGPDLGEPKPRPTFAREKKQHPSLTHQVERLDEKQKCKAYKPKVKRWLAPKSQPPV